MRRLAPWQRTGEAFDAPDHLHGGAPRKGEKENASRLLTLRDKMGNAMCERVCLARPGARDDEQRPIRWMNRRRTLLRVERRAQPG